MATFSKPQFNSVWATSGAKVAPDAAKINLGWVVEIPPHELDNWIRNRQDALLAHINQMGVVAWDETVEYQANKSYVQGSTTGNVYRAVTTHTGVNPETDVNGNWQVAFERGGSALLKAENLADVPDKALARQHLGISTTSDYDVRYLQRSRNLADVPNKATGRANLEVYSRQEVIDLINNMQPAGEVAAFARSTPPEGWLVCNGQAVSRTTYARLFAAVGTTFGAGNGSTTFRIPDLRGEFIRGWDNGRGADNGRVLGSAQSSQNLLHTHAGNTAEAGEHFHGGLDEYGFDASHGNGSKLRADMGDGPPWSGIVRSARAGKHTHSFVTSGEGGNESRPRNIALLYCIRT